MIASAIIIIIMDVRLVKSCFDVGVHILRTDCPMVWTADICNF